MPNYSHIISDMRWSFSRITAFEHCPYGWLLKYVFNVKPTALFFSSYGTFMHTLLADYLSGEADRQQLTLKYLTQFRDEVQSKAPNQKVFSNYFNQGLSFLRELSFPRNNIIDVEKRYNFKVGEKEFIGFVDYITRDESGIETGDHKSGDIKEPVESAKPSKTKIAQMERFDTYVKQQYLYSIPVAEEYGEQPKAINLHCFRFGRLIKIPFMQSKLDETKSWALRSIEHITSNEDWTPAIDFFKCRYLCDVHEQCEYYNN